MKSFLSSLTFLFTAASTQIQAAPEVLPLTSKDIMQAKLESIPPFPAELILKGKQQNWMSILHQGEIVVSIYESTPALIDVRDPFPYDEFVVVLEGRVTLTHIDGTKQTFTAGEHFLVPKGWMGSWDMPVHYREMIVVETKAWQQTEG